MQGEKEMVVKDISDTITTKRGFLRQRRRQREPLAGQQVFPQSSSRQEPPQLQPGPGEKALEGGQGQGPPAYGPPLLPLGGQSGLSSASALTVHPPAAGD